LSRLRVAEFLSDHVTSLKHADRREGASQRKRGRALTVPVRLEAGD